MPQLDSFLLQSQINLILIFFLGYIIFLKYILPLISFMLKVQNKLIVSQLGWFLNNNFLIVFHFDNLLVNFVKLSSFFRISRYLKVDFFTFFDLTHYDFLFLRNKN
uniref:ATP synthase protein 8 n=1 Tax=Pleurostomum flabellatum TaxID=405751 RepID=A0A7T0M460_9EUKA|nr:ATP synthase protein 8 [Pleurostomum flabellatum]QPL15628.1 ATP synthase protein 8 [Pleurostomum flabellatum]